MCGLNVFGGFFRLLVTMQGVTKVHKLQNFTTTMQPRTHKNLPPKGAEASSTVTLGEGTVAVARQTHWDTLD